MTERDTLIRSIAGRIEQSGQDGGAAAHDPAAGQEAERLLAGHLATPGGVDPEVQYTVGLLYLLRQLTRGPDGASPRNTEPQHTEPQQTGAEGTGEQTRERDTGTQDDAGAEDTGEQILALTLLAPFYMNPPGARDVLPPPVRATLDQIPGYGPPPSGDAERERAHAAALNDLGMLLAGLRASTGQPSQARAAAVVLRGAAGRFAPGSADRAMAQCNLGYAIILGEPGPEEVTEAVGVLRESLRHTPPGDANYARCANGLGLALMAASAPAKDRAMLAEAATMLRTATTAASASAPGTAPNLPQMLSDLGFALTAHVNSAPDEQASDPRLAAEAAEAVEVLTRAADLFPAQAPQRPQVLLRLAEALIAAGRPGEATGLLLANDALFPPDSQQFEDAKPVLARAALRKKWQEREADPDTQAIHALSEGFEADLKDPSSLMSGLLRLVGMEEGADRSKNADLMNFGTEMLATDTGDPFQVLRLVTRAQEMTERRFADLPEGEREQARQEYLASLGAKKDEKPSLSMFTPLEAADAAAVDELLGICERLRPELDPAGRERVMIDMSVRGLTLLKTIHRPLQDRAALRASMEELMPMLREMMESLQRDLPKFGVSPDLFLPRVTFAHVSASPFESLALIQESVRELRRRVAATSPGTREHDEARTVLAIWLFTVVGVTRDADAMTEARAIARDLVATAWPPSAVMISTWCQRESARLGPAASLTEDADRAGQAEGAGQVQHFLSRHASGETARVLAEHDATGALETLEDGRSWMLSHALNTRGDLDTLRAADADAYGRLLAVKDRLVQGQRMLARAGRLPTEAEGMTYARLSEEGARLVAELSQRPGFARFLMPVRLGLADLRPAAADGPVISVNVHPRRCDALILTSGGDRPVVVPLPGLTAGDVAEQAEGFRAAVAVLTEDPGSPASAAAARIFGDVLGWLWDELAEPVLEALELGQQPLPGMPWPRVWWSPTGLLNAFPLHAAGHHDRPGASVLDRAVSSYTPTIRALLRSRAHAARTAGPGAGPGTGPGGGPERRDRQVLAVAMPETAGLAPLRRTAAEAQAASADGGRRLTGPDATRQAVLAVLPDSSVAHFACHADSDPGDPTASHLRLHDGTLALGEVAGLRLDGAELAYLSACGTSRGGARLADEALHLASAFQLAGYSQSVATLWEVGDDFAAEAAAGFYRRLAPALAAPAPLPAAAALHATVRALRDSGRAAPWMWSALVHAGA